jgi:23S rRNA (pseudouridine1915-N3)-methyltransferase
VGRLKERYLTEGVTEYRRRMTPFARVEIAEIPEEPFTAGASEAEVWQVQEREAARLSRQVPGDSYVIALDRQGRLLTSEGFASLFADVALVGRSSFTFLIGGALGLHPSLLDSAAGVVSFSRLTFPHQLFRLILIEQLYRAFKINRGEPYHW